MQPLGLKYVIFIAQAIFVMVVSLRCIDVQFCLGKRLYGPPFWLQREERKNSQSLFATNSWNATNKLESDMVCSDKEEFAAQEKR